ncbi:NADPH:quinone reductase-like Zn-dependent oxidoreductase [Actinoplanes lutulentus]|uniref:NADPH:quinone reductase-like Zn-dependent oxidoreductase n=1 Tax=Actinoplanes lutulentus TaxID=1287878 RepID=A0A327ZG59_9ACTN|nr:NADP-dependent oxidoreductase [Actinoplanes lutulentus]MBB2947239.1 NADPH:quinone reductase-like Zn-dependent oxidoreductase [Actinoplanes lutulentus]RAK36514.1 NADPH:quinone reductase-like Zn-dependent oxidoreductase [Actinoplanes lutulentus]
MRAVSYAEFGGPEVLRVAEVPVPAPGPGQVRVRVAASVLHPVDLMVRSGRFPAPLPTGLPYTPGWDVAGVVDAAGDAVEQFAPGDEVIGFSPWLQTTSGAHAEYVVLDAASLTGAPSGVPATEAATLPTNGLAAAQALDLLELPEGSTVLVTGAAGQVGGFVLALARAAGLRATGLAGDGDREFVESLGATFLARTEEPAGVFDAVIDLAVIGSALLDRVRDGGGFVAASPPLRPEPVRGIRTFAMEVSSDGSRLEGLVKLVTSGDIPLRVAGVYRFDDAAAAHDRLARGGVRGAVVIVP